VTVEPAAPTAQRAPGGVSVRLDGVVHIYRQGERDVVALRGVDLHVDAGEAMALLGPSGMGKTTVIRVIAGLVRPSAGTVMVGERNIRKLSASERRELRAGAITYVLQGTEPNLLPFATALQNVWFAQRGAARHGATAWAPADLLDLLGLGHVAHEQVARLPRGLRQQVALASAVSAAPRLLLADEPTSQLDPRATDEVVGLLERINAELGTTIVLVTHDSAVAARLPRTVTIRDGRVGAEGRHGKEYAVVDGAGSVQLPPDVLEVLPPHTRVEVVRRPEGVELRRPRSR
jgi:ABC-type lipoprotein export system ATPase subunit